MKFVFKKLAWLFILSFLHTVISMQEDESTRKKNDHTIKKLFAHNKTYALVLVGQAEKMRTSVKMKEKDKTGRADTLSSFDGKTGYVRIPLKGNQECYRTISRFKQLIEEPLSEDDDILEGPNREVAVPDAHNLVNEKIKKKKCCCLLH